MKKDVVIDSLQAHCRQYKTMFEFRQSSDMLNCIILIYLPTYMYIVHGH